MIRVADGSYQLLSGNQIAFSMLDYSECRTKRRIAPDNGVAIKSIVSTDLADAIIEKAYGLEMVEVIDWILNLLLRRLRIMKKQMNIHSWKWDSKQVFRLLQCNHLCVIKTRSKL